MLPDRIAVDHLNGAGRYRLGRARSDGRDEHQNAEESDHEW
jgi:hypothetical protein